jgi:hypothetical protein
MDADDVKASFRAGRLIEHALKCGPAIIRCRGTCLYKLCGDGPTLGLAKTARQVSLRRNGYVAGRLTAGAYP